MPGVPTFEELGHPELNILSLDRTVAAPPNIDPQATAILRKAFTDAMNDPDFLAAAKHANIEDIAPLDGDQAAALIDKGLGLFEQYKDILANPAQ